MEEAKTKEKQEHAPILASDIDQSILEIARLTHIMLACYKILNLNK